MDSASGADRALRPFVVETRVLGRLKLLGRVLPVEKKSIENTFCSGLQRPLHLSRDLKPPPRRFYREHILFKYQDVDSHGGQVQKQIDKAVDILESQCSLCVQNYSLCVPNITDK